MSVCVCLHWLNSTVCMFVCVCVCVCASLAASHYHIEKFLSCTADKGGGEERGQGGKERACLRKNNKLLLIWLLAHLASLFPSFCLSFSLPDCITAEWETAIQIHQRRTPAVFAAVSSLYIVFGFFCFLCLLLRTLPFFQWLSPSVCSYLFSYTFYLLCLFLSLP